MLTEGIYNQSRDVEAMVLTCAIDAKEGRHVAVTDIPGAFLHADMDQDVHMIREGEIAELIVKLEPYSTGSMYGKINKANLCYTYS